MGVKVSMARFRASGRIERIIRILILLSATFSMVISIKQSHFESHRHEVEDHQHRNGHGLDGQGNNKDIKIGLQSKLVDHHVQRHILYLKPTDGHDEYGLKSYRYFEEDKLRRENSKVLRAYLKRKKSMNDKEKMAELSSLFKEALSSLKSHSKNKKRTNTNKDIYRENTKLTMLVQPMIISESEQVKRVINI
jgi:hypothetical protein